MPMGEDDMNPTERPTAIVAGPTGVGKTQLGVALARRHGFELVSADSMQVYRGLEIGSAQPTAEVEKHLWSAVERRIIRI